jgi:hypothetical protein
MIRLAPAEVQAMFTLEENDECEEKVEDGRLSTVHNFMADAQLSKGCAVGALYKKHAASGVCASGVHANGVCN